MKALSKFCMSLPTCAVLLSFVPDVQAQTIAVVNVDLRNARILQNIANNLDVNVSNIPISVQLPVNAAANVCQVTVALLSSAFQRGGATCTAQNTSLALLNIVQHQINHQR